MTRKEIHAAWITLSYDVRRLGGIIVGPIDNLIMDDLAEWTKLVNKVREAFDTTADETAQFLAYEVARKTEYEKVLVSDDKGDIHFIEAPFLGAERSLCGKRLHSINTTRVKDKHCVSCVGCLIAMYHKKD